MYIDWIIQSRDIGQETSIVYIFLPKNELFLKAIKKYDHLKKRAGVDPVTNHF